VNNTDTRESSPLNMSKVANASAVVASVSITVAYILFQSFPGLLYVLSNASEFAFSLIPLFVAFYAIRKKDFAFAKSTRWLRLVSCFGLLVKLHTASTLYF